MYSLSRLFFKLKKSCPAYISALTKSISCKFCTLKISMAATALALFSGSFIFAIASSAINNAPSQSPSIPISLILSNIFLSSITMSARQLCLFILYKMSDFLSKTSNSPVKKFWCPPEATPTQTKVMFLFVLVFVFSTTSTLSQLLPILTSLSSIAFLLSLKLMANSLLPQSSIYFNAFPILQATSPPHATIISTLLFTTSSAHLFSSLICT